MKDFYWKLYFTTAVVATAIVLDAPAVMWSLCLVVLTEVY